MTGHVAQEGALIKVEKLNTGHCPFLTVPEKVAEIIPLAADRSIRHLTNEKSWRQFQLS